LIQASAVGRYHTRSNHGSEKQQIFRVLVEPQAGLLRFQNVRPGQSRGWREQQAFKPGRREEINRQQEQQVGGTPASKAWHARPFFYTKRRLWMRVALVEDDPAMQRELSRAIGLLPAGKVVLIAETAARALAWFAANPEEWDLAIVDMFLKEGHGFEVLKRCPKPLPHQRTVMLSNYGRDQVDRYASAAGADRFFDKSFDLDALWAYCQERSAALELKE